MIQSTELAPERAELLRLDVASLSGTQQRGASCAWCMTRLKAETAVDLGEEPAGDGTILFLRGCKLCALPFAMRALQDHTGTCEQCADDHTQCVTGMSLVHLVREARR